MYIFFVMSIVTIATHYDQIFDIQRLKTGFTTIKEDRFSFNPLSKSDKHLISPTVSALN